MENKKSLTKVFVTGASGFIGEHLVNYLLEQKYEVFALVRSPFHNLPDFNKNLHLVYGDITQKDELEKLIPDNCYVVNLAANPYHKKKSWSVNVEGMGNLLGACKKKNIKKIIHISSQAVNIKNKGVYAKTKLLSEEIITKSDVPHVILRPSLVYGPGEKGLFIKIKKAFNLLPFVPVFGNGKIELFPIYVEDLCHIIKIILGKKMKKNLYDVGGESIVTYNNLYKNILQLNSLKKKIIHIPAIIGLFIAKLISFLPNPPLIEDNILGSTQPTYCNPFPLLKELNVKVFSFFEGIKLTKEKQKKLNVAIVGLGKMGILHSSILSTFKDVKIVALVDNNPTLYQTIKSMGAAGTFYSSLEEAIKKTDIDLVYICTPTFTHYQLANFVIRQKKHVFIEKPVGLTINEVQKLLDIKTKSRIGVGYTLVYKRTFKKAFDYIKNKTLGDIKLFSASFLHGEVFGIKKGWMFQKKTAGGGVMMNPGPHLFSIIQLLFGNPKKIKGIIKQIYSSVDDEANLKFDYGSYFGDIYLSWSVKNKPISETKIIIKFTKGTLIITDKELTVTTKLKSQTYVEKDLEQYPFPVFNINPEAHGEAYFAEDRLFIDSIKDKAIFPTSLDFAYLVEKIIHNSYAESVYEKK